MLDIAFEGWFQCRLATDPDRYDHPRGERGWTFAAPGEPDLDRVIRFHDPVAPRTHGPEIGVWVREAQNEAGPLPNHPLRRARVELLDGAVFEGRNGEIAPDAQEPIVPFHLRIVGGGVEVRREDPLDLGDPDDLMRRFPVDFDVRSPEVAEATGIADPGAFRQERRRRLEQDLLAADPLGQEALRMRLRHLQEPGPALVSLGYRLEYQFELRGAAVVADPERRLGTEIDLHSPWPIRFWMGGWDADALCGYVRGALRLAP